MGKERRGVKGYSRGWGICYHNHMRDSKTTRFKKTIRITPKDLDWINKNKRSKSAAGYLEELIKIFKDF